MKQKSLLKQLISGSILLFFLLFLALPLLKIISTALLSESGAPAIHLNQVFNNKWQQAFANSLGYSLTAAGCSTVLGFLLAYGNNFTAIGQRFLKINTSILLLPMLLPTITYGFVLIYSFGKQGLWSRLLHGEWFNVYGKIGLLLGLIVYTLPPIFILLNNAMTYLDTRLFVVSRLMQDSWQQSLHKTVLSPMYRILAAAFIQGFFMSFTDFGIPSAVGGQTPFITTLLYEGFMGTIPNFQRGAIIALTMLLPSVLSIFLLSRLQKKNVRYQKPQALSLKKNPVRDWLFRFVFFACSLFILGIFAVLFVIPFVTDWPYKLQPTLNNLVHFIQDDSLVGVLSNSLIMAFSTAVLGTLLAYLAAILTSREQKETRVSQLIDSLSTLTNSIPGMVLGVAYLLIFSGSSLHNSLLILVCVTAVHYFATPYQMAKEALQKMDLNRENTARLMGDRWIDTVYRILIPNSKATIIDMFGYYFFNSMVTLSAVIFLASTETMVITAKLKELQHFGRFNDIFMLSLFLLLINLSVQTIIQFTKRRLTTHENGKKSHTALLHRLPLLIKRLQQRQRS